MQVFKHGFAPAMFIDVPNQRIGGCRQSMNRHLIAILKVELDRSLQLSSGRFELAELHRNPPLVDSTQRPGSAADRRQAGVSSIRLPRHMKTPRMSIHTRRTELAGMFIAIAGPEKPVYAITPPATLVGMPPTITRPPT